jgi:hypothetical protein
MDEGNALRIAIEKAQQDGLQVGQLEWSMIEWGWWIFHFVTPEQWIAVNALDGEVILDGR